MVSRSFEELVRTGSQEFGSNYGIYEKINGEFIGRTFGEFYSDVRSLANSLIDVGLQGKNIMLYGNNSYNWMVSYLAIATYVGKVVPIDKEWKTNDISHILSSVEISHILYSSHLSENLVDTEIPKTNLENELTDLIVSGRNMEQKYSNEKQDGNRICVIIFTSGSTSKPKKIELSERNLVANGECLNEGVKITLQDHYYCALPFSHIAPMLASFIYPLSMGASLYIPNDFKELGEDLKLVKPTIFYGVPKVFEKIWEVIPADKKAQINKGIKISNLLRKFGIDKRKKLFAEFHNGLGGNVRFAYSGSIKLDEKIIKIYDDMGLQILQAYGLTETSAIVSCDFIDDYCLGSVGKVLRNQECKIIEQDEKGIGEICVRGDNVAKCALSDDGYLHTGDLGYLDKDGYLFLVGRKKRLIKLSNAKNVYPDEIESLLEESPLIDRAMVYEKDGKIVADIVSKCNKAELEAFIEQFNQGMPHFKWIQSFHIVPELHDKLKY